MFYGEYQHTIDTKGRLIIPSKFRAPLKSQFIDRFIITQGLDKCLWVFTESAWNALVQKAKSFPLTKSEPRKFLRILYSGAFEIACDKQGRINIPEKLLKYAGIQRDVAIIGVSDRFEIWDVATWDQFRQAAEEKYEEIAENLGGYSDLSL